MIGAVEDIQPGKFVEPDNAMKAAFCVAPEIAAELYVSTVIRQGPIG